MNTIRLMTDESSVSFKNSENLSKKERTMRRMVYAYQARVLVVYIHLHAYMYMYKYCNTQDKPNVNMGLKFAISAH